MSGHGDATDTRTELRPRFPLADVRDWANRYSYLDDAEVEAIGEAARRAGYYTRDQLLIVGTWKSPRPRRLFAENDDATVRGATARALATSDERERIRELVALRGVQMPTASVLLHLARGDAFPIIDFRALWSLGVDEPPNSYSFEYWWAYALACRRMAATAGVSMRVLDRALWQYSKENQPARGRPQARATAAKVRMPLQPVGGRSVVAPMPFNFPTRTYLRLIEAATASRILVYSDLPGSRRIWGRDLYRIADYERAHKRPPLTAIVVHKQTGKPGEGFAVAMEQIGFARPGEAVGDMWERAIAAVFRYWKP